MDEKTTNAGEGALSDQRLQGRLRKMLRDARHVERLQIQYIRREWGKPLVCAVVFDEGSEEPSILVVNERRDGWLWAVDRWS